MLRALLVHRHRRQQVLGLHPRLGPRVGDTGHADARAASPARAVAEDGAGIGSHDGRELDPADAEGSGVEAFRVGVGGEWRLSGMEWGVLRAVEGVAGVSGEVAVLGAEGG